MWDKYAIGFFVLAIVVTVGAIWALVTEASPDESPLGIGYLALTAVVIGAGFAIDVGQYKATL